MKKTLLILIVSTILFSCSNKEQYYGKWIATENPQEKPIYIKITSDSIALSQNEMIWSTYPISIKNRSLTFSGQTFESSVTKDTLQIDNQTYKKINNQDPIEITVPKLKEYDFEELLLTYETIDLYYGKKPNTDEFYIRYNDKFLKLDSLHTILMNHTRDVYRYVYKIVLHCDQNVKMKDLEFFFLTSSSFRFYTIFLTNNEVQPFNAPLGQKNVSLEFHSLKQFMEVNPNYKTEIISQNTNGKFGQIASYIDQNNSFQYTFLIKNEFYFGKEKLSKQAFSEKIKMAIKGKKPLLMLYDLASNYKSYLEIVSIYKSLLNDERNKTAISLFSTSFESLNESQQDSIKTIHPYINIRQYSIPHFLSFEESPEENTEFPFKNVKEQIPEVYFEGLK